MVNDKTYVIAPNFLDDGYYHVILTDWLYWASHYDELQDWCMRNLFLREKASEGSVVTLINKQEFVLFTLRWS